MEHEQTKTGATRKLFVTEYHNDCGLFIDNYHDITIIYYTHRSNKNSIGNI